ncbi:protamine P1 protein, partial [Toxoplasma gondii GT1]
TTAGFRFASGREVTVSEEARRKAREMLQLEAAESEAREQGEQGAGGSMRRDEAGRTDGHETQGIGTTAGFRFASGREVTVSEEARRKAREMLQLEAAESEVREQGEQGAGGSMRRDEAGRTDGHETQGIGTTAGFRFASGREVTVSEEARRKAREMLQLEADESEVREKGEQGAGGSMRRDEAGRTDGHETQGIGTTAGFRFASGREVTVSEEARRKAREMLQLEATGREEVCQQTDVANGLGNEVGFTMTGVCTPPGALVSCHPISGSVACIPSVGSPSPSKLFASFAVSSCCATVAGIGPGSVPLVSVLGGCGDCGADLGERDPGRVTGPGTGEETDREPSASHFVRMQSTAQPSCVTNHDEARKFQSSVPSEATECSQVSLPSPSSALRSAPSLSDSSAPAGQPASEVENRSSSSLSSRARPPSLRRRGLTSGLLGVPRLAASGVGAQDARAAVPRDRRHFKAPRRNSQTASLGGQRPRVQERTREDLVKAKQEDASRSEGSGEKEEKQYCFPEAQTNVLRASGTHFSSLFSVSTEPKDLSFPSSACSSSLPQVSDASPLYQNMLVIRRLWELHARRFSICLSPLSRSADPTARVSSSPYPQSPSSLWPPAPLPAAVSPDSRDACERRNFQFSFLDRGLWLVCLPEHLHKRTVPLFCGSLEAARDFLLLSCTARGDECIEDSSGWSRGASSGCRAREDNAGTRAEDGSADGDSGGRSMLVGGVEEFSRMVGTYLQWKREVKRESPSTASSALLEKTRNGKKRRETPELRGNRNRFTRAWVAHHYSLLCLRAAQRWTRSFALSVASYRHESHHRNSCTGSSSTLSHSFLRHPPLQTSAVSLQGPRDAVAPAPPFSSPSRPSACPASVQSFLGPPRPPSPLRLLRALLCRVEAEEEGRRSVLRQVCEGDLSPATPMVLEVLCPPFCSEDPLSLRVSDGWYVVKARVVDPSLAVVLRRIFQRRDNRSHAAQTPHSPPFPRFSFRRIFVQGASLSGLSEPCCPLDLPSQACLLLHASTCRPLFSPLPLLSSPASSLPSFLMATDSKAPLPSAPSPVASCPLFSSLLFAPEWLGKGCASSLASLRGSAFPLGRWLSGRGERKQRTGGREEKEEEERAVPQAVKSLRRGVGGEIPVVDVILLRRGPLLFRVRREVPKPGGSGRPLETREGSRENEHPPENDVGDSEPRETKTVLMTEAEYRAWFQREQETLQRKREEELVLLQEKLEEVRRKTESKKAKRRRTPCLQTREEDDGDGETAESGGKDKTSLRKEAPQREEEGHTCEERDCEATLSEEEAEDELRDLERQLTRLEELWRVDRENLAKKGQSQIDLLVVDSLFLHKLSALALMAFANVATSASAPSHVKASVNCVSFLDASGPPSRSSLCGVDQVAVASSSDPRCVASASSNVPPTVSSSLAPPLAPLPVPPAAASSSSSPSFVSCSSSSNSSSPLAASTSVSASGVSLAPSFGVSQTDIENALDSALEEETETKHHTSTSSSMVSSPSLRASRSTVSPQSSAPAAPFEFAVANSGCRSRRPSDSQQHASEAPHSRTERRDEAKLPTHAKSPPATYARDRSVNSKPCEDLLSLLRLCGCLRPRKVEEETDLRTVAGLARLFRQSLACITLSGDPATEEETPFHELQEGERVKISNLACSPAASVYSTRQRRHGQEPDRGGGGGGTGKWTDEWSELNAAEEERRLGVIDCHGNQRLVRLHGTKRTAFQIVRLAPGSALSPHPSGSHPAVSSPHVSAFFPSPPSSSPPSSSRYPSCSSRPFASPSLSRSPPSSSLVRLLPVCTAGSGGSRPLPFAVPLSVLSTSLRASLAAFSSALSPLRSPSSSAALSPSAGASAASGAAERENCQLGEGARSNLFADGPTPGAEREGERREEANDGEPSEELDEAEGGKKRQQGRGRRRAPSSSVKGALDATAQKRQKRQLAELPRHCCAAAKDFEQTERGASPSGSDLGCKEKRERLTTRLSAKRSTCRPPDSGPGAETKEESKRRNAEDKGTKVESAFLLSALSQWLLPLSSLDVLLGLCHLPLFSQAHRLACLLKEADREREREQEVLQREEKEASTATEGRRLRERGELTLRPRKEMFFRGEAANHVRERDERRAQDRGRWPHFPETQVLNERLSKSGEEGKENVWQQLADAESVIAKGILKGQASESMQCLQRHGLKGSEQTESCVSPPDSLYRFTAPPISIGILPAVAYDLVGVLLLLEDHQVSPLLGSYSADSAQTCSAFVGSERHASPSGLVAFLWTSTDQICCIRVKPSRNFSDFSVNSGSHSRLEAPSSSSSSSSSSLASASRSGREATGCSASREAPAGGCPFLLRYRQMLLGAAGRRNAGTTEGVKARQGVTAERAEGLQRWWMFQTEERGKVESGIKEKKHSLTGSVCVSSISSSVAASLSPGFLSLRWALFQNVEFQGRDPNLGIFNFSASPRLLHLASGPLHAPLPSKVSPVFSTSSAYTNSLPFSRNSSSRQFPSSSLPRSSCLNSPFASDSPPPCSTSSSSAAGASSSSVLASSLCPAASPADAHSGLHPYCTEEEEREGEDKSESRDTGGSDSDFGDRKARKKNGVREGREHGVTETSQRVSGQREGARGEKQSGRRPPDSAMRQEDPRKNMRLREERNESEMRNEVDAPASKGSDKEGEREEGDRKVKRQRTTPKRPSCRVEGKEERSITVCAVGMNDCLSEDRTVSTKRAAKPRNQRGEAADFISFETAYGDWKETACFSDRHEFEKANRFSFLQDEICDLFRFLGAPEAAPASSDRRGIDRAKPLLHNDRARLDIQSADQPGGRSEGDKQRPPSDENRPLDRNWDPRCSGKEQLVRGRGALNDWDRAIRGEARELEEERGEKTENGREGRGEAAESDRQGDHVEQCMRSCGGDTALSRLLLALEKVASAVGARRL